MAELKFVDSVDVAPVVLLDLAASPLAVTSFSAPPPVMRRSEASSFLTDGAVDAATAFDRRELSVGLAFVASSASESAEVWQELVRLLTSPGWLMYVDDAGVPLFFRTHPSSPSEVEEYRAALRQGERTATLTIPADPFAYGLPESGTATVANDPTEPNGMRFTVEDVKGDVPAPLRLAVEFGGGTWDSAGNRGVIGLGSGAVALPNNEAVGTTGDGWTATTVSDATAIGGSYERITGSGSAGEDGPRVTVGFPLDSGEYRLIARARSSVPVKFYLSTHLGDVGESQETRSTWGWIDLGVFRLPTGAPQAGDWGATESPGVGLVVSSTLTDDAAPGTTVDVDHIVAVPAPGADGATGTLGFVAATSPPDPFVTDGVMIDGETDRVWALYGILTPGVDPLPFTWENSGGALPRVTPGLPTQVTIWPEREPGGTDKKTRTFAVDWSYHPRYLYLRGD